MKKTLIKYYESLYEIHGIGGGLWDQMFTSYHPYVFCDANKKRIITMYLELEAFVEDAKKYGVFYYCGIDDFLSAYHTAVYNCLNIK